MQHSHEALDRPGGFSRVNLLAPLRHRDFRLLWAGMTVSLVGDGIFLVAMAWQAYDLWNAPAALSILGIGMTIPTIAFLLPAGVLSDRLDRRLIMLTADVGRALVVATLAALSIADLLTFWQLVVLVGLYGIGTAFFIPAFDAIVPDVVPSDELPAANALDQFVRPIALRLLGPALGGGLVAALGLGAAFSVDAASFVASTVAVFLMHRPASTGARHAESACGSCGAGSGCGAPSSRPRSPTWRFSDRRKCFCRTSSRTTCTPRRANSVSCSPREESGRSARLSSWGSWDTRGAT
jgi:MFS family permease